MTSLWGKWQQLLSVNGCAIGEMPRDIEVAVRVGHCADDAVIYIIRPGVLPRIALHPVEVLGVGAEGGGKEDGKEDEPF